MNNETKLKNIFAQFAGKEIKNPNRMTRDMCDVVDSDLQRKVSGLGFIFGMHKKGTAETMVLKPENLVRAEYEETKGKFRLTGKYKIGNQR